MAIKLTLSPNNDVLVPVQSLKNWSKKTLDKKQNQKLSFLDKIFKEKELEAQKEKIGEINNTIGRLPTKGLAWFQQVFLTPWGGKATPEAQKIFDALKKEPSFGELEQSVGDSANRIKGFLDNVAKAATDLTNVLSAENGISKAAGDLGRAFNQMAAAGAAGTPPTGGPPVPPPTGTLRPDQISKIKLSLVSDPNLLSAFNISQKPQTNYDAAAITKMTDDLFSNAIKSAAKSNARGAKRKDITNLLTTNGVDARTFLAESKNLSTHNTTRKLYELGLITDNGYLASLVTTKQKLAEAPPAPGGAPPTMDENEKAIVGGAITALIGPEGQPDQGFLKKMLDISTVIQNGFSKTSESLIKESLLNDQKQLIKERIKKKIITERPEILKEEYLNEFLGVLLMAALGGLLAWAASKLSGFFKGSGNGYATTIRVADTASPQDVSKTLEGLIGGYNSQGALVNASGKPATNLKEGIGLQIQSLTNLNQGINQAIEALKNNAPAFVENPTVTPIMATLVAPSNQVGTLIKTLQAFETKF